MFTLLSLVSITLILSFLSTLLARQVAPRLGLVDRPDGRRKTHVRAIPLTGGIAIFTAMALTCLIVALDRGSELAADLAQQGRLLVGLAIASLGIVLLGVLDDKGRLRGRQKLLGQVVAVLVLLASGLVIRSIPILGWHHELGLLAYPFTAAWLLLTINAINLIDGMDGLLGIVTVLASLSFAALAAFNGNSACVFLSLCLCSAVIGFLCFNFPPASIFLGDAGSMLIGLLLGFLSIRTTLTKDAVFGPVVPAAILVLPFFDTLAALIRRKLTGRSIFATDRGHLHHCILRCGYTPRGVLAVVAALSILSCLGVLASVALRSGFFAAGAAVAVVVILSTSDLFGQCEFRLIRSVVVMFLSWLFRGSAPYRSEICLQGNGRWADVWDELVRSAPGRNLVRMRLDINAPMLHEGYHGRWDSAHRATEEYPILWHMEFPLFVQGVAMGRLEVFGRRSNDDSLSLDVEEVSGIVTRLERAVTLLVCEESCPTLDCPAPIPPPLCNLVTSPSLATTDENKILTI